MTNPASAVAGGTTGPEAVDLEQAPPVEPLAVRVERQIKEGRLTLPVMPAVALEVQRLIEAEAGIPAIAAAIGRDPSIAAAVVKYANSAMYAGLREVTDIQQAVMRLGLLPVQQAVTALSARSLFERAAPAHAEFYKRIWRHSLTTALAARRLASRVRIAPDTAFLAGLLHDLGKVVVLQSAAGLQGRAPAGFAIDDATVLEFVEALHCPVGDMLFETWKIPSDLRDVLRRHHDPSLSGVGDMLVAVVQMADLLAAKVGASLHPDPELSLVDCPAAALLRLDDVKLASLLVDLEDDLEATHDAF
ncbi:MAG: HDOD domain-containing protein [Vicinamibacterales bacterium]